MPILFGTDGWRGVIAREFTFDNLSIVAQATMDYLINEKLADRPLLIGYDRRFLSKEFAERVSEIAAGNGIKTFLTNDFAPTPSVSWAVYDMGASAGIMITASHNPATYNGFKIKESFGGSARPATTKAIETVIAKNISLNRKIISTPFAGAIASGEIVMFDPEASYIAQLKKFVDIDAIIKAGIKVVVDPMYGAGSGVLAKIIPGVTEIHSCHNPAFGGIPPEPTEQNLQQLAEEVKSGGFTVGLALDGDADRIGAVDETGAFFSSHMIFTVLLRHLYEFKGLKGGVVKTVSTTRMVDLLAEKFGLELYETPIGFKHICEYMLDKDILMGGEESGGLGVKGHIPERDGVLMGLLLLEAVAISGKPLRALLNDIMDEIGHFYYRRIDMSIDGEAKKTLSDKLTNEGLTHIGNRKISSINFKDGFKFIFEDHSWLLIRPSGTEPVLRLYSEAGDPAQVESLLSSARQLVYAGVD